MTFVMLTALVVVIKLSGQDFFISILLFLSGLLKEVDGYSGDVRVMMDIGDDMKRERKTVEEVQQGAILTVET